MDIFTYERARSKDYPKINFEDLKSIVHKMSITMVTDHDLEMLLE